MTEIPYVPTGEGGLDLAGVKEVFTCARVGYAMGERLTQDLTGRALFRAAQWKRPAAGLIPPSDRGRPSCAHAYRQRLEPFSRRASMSRQGNGDDHAPRESFGGRRKPERAHPHRYATRAQAQASLREYIEVFYNRPRRHSRLGYLAPAVLAQKFSKQAAAA